MQSRGLFLFLKKPLCLLAILWQDLHFAMNDKGINSLRTYA